MNEIEDLDLDLIGRTIVGVRSMTQHEIEVTFHSHLGKF